MNLKNITVANAVFRSFSKRYLVEGRGVTDNVTESNEKEIVLPWYMETINSAKECSGVEVSTSPNAELTTLGIHNDVNAVSMVIGNALQAFLRNYNYSVSKLFTSLSAKPSILYQVCLLTTGKFYEGYRVDPIQYGYRIVSLEAERAKREEEEREEARIRAIVDDWKKAESDYVDALDLNASRLYYVNKNDGFLPDCLKEAYNRAKPYLKR